MTPLRQFYFSPYPIRQRPECPLSIGLVALRTAGTPCLSSVSKGVWRRPILLCSWGLHPQTPGHFTLSANDMIAEEAVLPDPDEWWRRDTWRVPCPRAMLLATGEKCRGSGGRATGITRSPTCKYARAGGVTFLSARRTWGAAAPARRAKENSPGIHPWVTRAPHPESPVRDERTLCTCHPSFAPAGLGDLRVLDLG